jgi:hypothetical protein
MADTAQFTGSLVEGEVCRSCFLSGKLGLHRLHCHDFDHDFRCLRLAVADALLWKDRNVSAGVLAGATLIWCMFEVVEYNIIPLLCQIAARRCHARDLHSVERRATLEHVWLSFATVSLQKSLSEMGHDAILPALHCRSPPSIPEVIISEHTFRQLAQTIHYKLAYTVATLYEIACGKDLKKFLLVHTIQLLYHPHKKKKNHGRLQNPSLKENFLQKSNLSKNIFKNVPKNTLKTIILLPSFNNAP